jgi:hypothetical protein
VRINHEWCVRELEGLNRLHGLEQSRVSVVGPHGRDRDLAAGLAPAAATTAVIVIVAASGDHEH